MTKLYYTDPLKAAYMAREFGVKLANNNTDKPVGMSLFAHHSTLDNYTGGSVSCLGIDADLYEGEEIYIHPDSNDIFEPQVGDLVLYCSTMRPRIIGKVTDGGYYDTEGLPMERNKYQYIIRRQHKQFFMPRAEL